MSSLSDPKLLALLVHEGLLTRELAEAAIRSGDVRAHLRQHGIDDEQWEAWRRTEAGTRPQLRRYALGELLGQGGTARVFAARDRTSDSEVALKVLLPRVVRDARAVDRFIRESRLLVDLDHPHIVKGLRVAREGNTVFCAMQLAAGECLQDRLARGEVLDEDEALRIVMQVARALSYLHGRGLVHRDVKPGNVIWSVEQRHAVLIDLGFAVRADEAGDGPAGTTAGTVHYISPEQARGAAELDVRADIYSLGATLYHLVTGSLPFSGETGEEVLAKQVLESLSSDRIRAMELSPQIHYFIEKMMAKDKEIRFQAPEQLAAEVGTWLTSRELERARPEPKTLRRRRRRFP